MVLEDALMNNLGTVAEFMVRDPLCCSLWQPPSLIRQQMLANSFSFLPVRIESCEWRMLSDQELARYLRVKAQRRKERLAKSLKSALTADERNDKITLLSVDTVCPTALPRMLLRNFKAYLSSSRVAAARPRMIGESLWLRGGVVLLGALVALDCARRPTTAVPAGDYLQTC